MISRKRAIRYGVNAGSSVRDEGGILSYNGIFCFKIAQTEIRVQILPYFFQVQRLTLQRCFLTHRWENPDKKVLVTFGRKLDLFIKFQTCGSETIDFCGFPSIITIRNLGGASWINL